MEALLHHTALIFMMFTFQKHFTFLAVSTTLLVPFFLSTLSLPTLPTEKSQDDTIPKLAFSIIRPKQSEKQIVIRRARSESREFSSTVDNYEPAVTTDAGEFTDVTDSYTVNFTEEILPTVTTQNSTDSHTGNIPTSTTNNSSSEVVNASTVSSCHQEQLGVAVLNPTDNNETGARAQRPTLVYNSPWGFPKFTNEDPRPTATQLLSANNPERTNEMSLCPWNYTVHIDETR